MRPAQTMWVRSALVSSCRKHLGSKSGMFIGVKATGAIGAESALRAVK